MPYTACTLTHIGLKQYSYNLYMYHKVKRTLIHYWCFFSQGTFAINTDHAVSSRLDRQPENWMIWEPSRIHLAWIGFSDIHSGLLEYHINIGSSYMAADLNEVK